MFLKGFYIIDDTDTCLRVVTLKKRINSKNYHLRRDKRLSAKTSAYLFFRVFFLYLMT